MYDLSLDFKKFYERYVLLSAEKQEELRNKRDINLDRLENGLKEYNKEHNTEFSIIESLTQGSMAMHTTIQNDSNDYDIDIAIIFDKNCLGDMGPRSIRCVVADALKRKCTQLNKEPEIKTNCVRIEYSSGYHVDFAIYRRTDNGMEYMYEHSGNEWSLRNPRAINDWFNNEIACYGDDLRKIIRLSKIFCKSRSAWVNMAPGLVQTVVCDEVYRQYDRIDKTFYYAMVAVKNRLDLSVNVNNPTDKAMSLLQNQKHRDEIINWHNRLSQKLDDLSVLFSSTCTDSQAREAWFKFFNHSFWEIDDKKVKCTKSVGNSVNYRNTEQFIENEYIMDLRYDVYVRCLIGKNGFRSSPIREFLQKCCGRLPHGFSIDCEMVETNAPSYDKVLWKVRNVGAVAEERDMIRGQISDRGTKIHEHSDFYGPHYIECYLIKGNRCIAKKRIDVPIDMN